MAGKAENAGNQSAPLVRKLLKKITFECKSNDGKYILLGRGEKHSGKREKEKPIFSPFLIMFSKTLFFDALFKVRIVWCGAKSQKGILLKYEKKKMKHKTEIYMFNYRDN